MEDSKALFIPGFGVLRIGSRSPVNRMVGRVKLAHGTMALALPSREAEMASSSTSRQAACLEDTRT